MAAPTSKWRTFPNNGSAVTATDTTAKRLAAIGNESPISTTGGQELDFGTLDISSTNQYSAVLNLIFDFENANSNVEATDFRIYQSNRGFTDDNTQVFLANLSNEVGTNNNTDDIVANAVTGSYTSPGFNTLGGGTTVPGAQNAYAADDTDTIDITTIDTTDEAIMQALFLFADADDTPGTYLGTTAGFEFQISQRYTYS